LASHNSDEMKSGLAVFVVVAQFIKFCVSVISRLVTRGEETIALLETVVNI